MRSRYLTLGLSVVLFAVGCGGSGSSPEGTGGSSGSGGSGSGGSASGGSSSGGSSSGGATASGGKIGTGGTVASGGVVGTSSGGATSSGGKVGTGGVASSGGMTGGSGTGGSTQTSTGGSGPAGGASGGGGKTTGPGGKMGSGGSTGAGGTAPAGMSGLPVPPGSGNVPQPTGTGSSVTVLNWAGFTGAVTYSFDDDNQSQIDDYKMLQDAGGQYTFFLWTNRSQATNAIWKQAMMDGHEIGNHTKSHDSTGACTAADVKAGGDFIMSTFGKPAQTFAAPNGSTCFKSPASMYYFINRGVSPANPVLPNDNSDPLNLNCYIPNTGQQTGTFNGNIDDAHKKGGWVIYVIHGFSSSDGSYQPVDIGQVTAAIKYAKGMNDMWVGSMVNIGAYWQGQKAFSSAMTSTSGGDKTWTWKLPEHFPPGHYLRVKTDGGTLKQNGATLAWDAHGYYEIALDALSVTLSP